MTKKIKIIDKRAQNPISGQGMVERFLTEPDVFIPFDPVTLHPLKVTVIEDKITLNELIKRGLSK